MTPPTLPPGAAPVNPRLTLTDGTRVPLSAQPDGYAPGGPRMWVLTLTDPADIALVRASGSYTLDIDERASESAFRLRLPIG